MRRRGGLEGREVREKKVNFLSTRICHSPFAMVYKCGPVCTAAAAAAAAAKSLQSCPTLCDPTDGSHQTPPSLGFSRQEHWSGLHFLLQRIKVKSESEVAQSCPTQRRF